MTSRQVLKKIGVIYLYVGVFFAWVKMLATFSWIFWANSPWGQLPPAWEGKGYLALILPNGFMALQGILTGLIYVIFWPFVIFAWSSGYNLIENLLLFPWYGI